eukprot:gb/GECG01010420.1/.p1 GENE.gb/GECG01010420.1/~~gb/GECG01010420.1/.p1  ORF type:complete len:224 (+),score=17.57 gb/GECG01010420.1/:1-672(+)
MSFALREKGASLVSRYHGGSYAGLGRLKGAQTSRVASVFFDPSSSNYALSEANVRSRTIYTEASGFYTVTSIGAKKAPSLVNKRTEQWTPLTNPGQVRYMGATGKVTTKARRRRPKAALELTDEAAERLKKMLENKSDAVGIRVGVTKRGCNGMSYTMNYATEAKKFDEKVEEKGVTILIEPRALMTVLGTTLDWHEDDISAEFVFNNPNAKGACGCGESFNI